MAGVARKCEMRDKGCHDATCSHGQASILKRASNLQVIAILYDAFALLTIAGNSGDRPYADSYLLACMDGCSIA